VCFFAFFCVEFINITVFGDKLPLPWKGKYRDFLDAIDECDVCVSLSGETINDYYYPHMYLRLLTYYLAILKHKEMILFPQSIGPVFKPLSKYLLRKVFGKAKVIVARDELSLKVAKELWANCKAKVVFSPDVAVTQESEVLPLDGFKVSKKVIGLTVSDIPKAEMGISNEYLDTLIDKVLKVFPSSDYSILLMPSNYKYGDLSGDYVYCLKAKEMLEAKKYTVDILKNEVIHPDVYQGYQKSLFAFISTRMHVGILASSAGIPTVMINTQHKIKAYMDIMHMGDYVVEVRDLESNLEKTLESLKLQNDNLRIELVKNNKMLRNSVHTCLSQL